MCFNVTNINHILTIFLSLAEIFFLLKSGESKQWWLFNFNHSGSNLCISMKKCHCKPCPISISLVGEGLAMEGQFWNYSGSFFKKYHTDAFKCFICGHSWDLNTLWFWVLNEKQMFYLTGSSSSTNVVIQTLLLMVVFRF